MKIPCKLYMIIIFILYGCGIISHHRSLSSQQSYVIDLTFECENNNQKSCETLIKEIEILKSMIK